MSVVNINERSWGIDLISGINEYILNKDLLVKHAGGENSLKSETNTLFPDVLLFADNASAKILIGWELKMPDTDINDEEFIKNAYIKALNLNLNSFLVWNVNQAKLYTIDENKEKNVIHEWSISTWLKDRSDVKNNREIWIELLYRIINDLNLYLEKDEIRAVSLLDSFSSSKIVDLVYSNKHLLAETYKSIISSSSEFEDSLNLWWESVKREYPNTKVCDALAELNLLSWIYKLIFANLIKKHFRTAYKIENISYSTSAKEAAAIIEEISTECDFWNIFKKQIGDESIPDVIWNDLVSYNYFLIDANIEYIPQANWQEIFEHLVSKNQRKLYGQFSTPPNLAKLLVNLTIDDKNKTVFDPCCGTGTIAKEAYELKKRYGIKSGAILDSIWASDKNAFPLQLTTLSLFDPNDMGAILNIFQKDVASVQTDEVLDFSDPYTGNTVKKTLPAFDYIVSNLPFVKGQDIPEDNEEILEIKDLISAYTKEKLVSKSDLSFYIPFKLWSLLKDDGKLGIIMSNSWLGTQAGETFKNILQKFFYIENIITSGKGRWFLNAEIVTNIIILKKKNIPDSSTNPNNISFSVLKEDIRDIDIEKNISKIRSQTCEDNKIVSKITYTREELEKLETIGIKWCSLFTDMKWLLQIMPKIIPLQSKFNIGRGERRGWDKLFYPTKKAAIEKKFLKPILKSPRALKGLIAKPDALAFCCDVGIEELEEKYPLTFKYVSGFITQKNNVGLPLPKVLKRRNMHWYEMNESTTATFVTSINADTRLFFAKFEEPTFVNQRLVRLTKKNKDDDTDIIFALLNSLLGMFFLEALAFGRGQGVADSNSTKIKKFAKMLNPDLLTQEQKNLIIEKFQPILERDILPFEKELNSSDRQEFDHCVLSAYNIAEFEEKIKNSLKYLYNLRKTVSSISSTDPVT